MSTQDGCSKFGETRSWWSAIPDSYSFSIFHNTQVGKDASYAFNCDDLVRSSKSVPKDCTVTVQGIDAMFTRLPHARMKMAGHGLQIVSLSLLGPVSSSTVSRPEPVFVSSVQQRGAVGTGPSGDGIPRLRHRHRVASST